MTISRAVLRALVVPTALVLLIAALVIAAPPVAHHLLIHYLAQAGIKAKIANVDVNLFTGRLLVDHAHGHGPGGGFNIGRLALSLRYRPLFSHRLLLRRLTLENARIEVARTQDNAWRVAGITVVKAKSKQRLGWGVGVQRVALDNVKIDYRQPGLRRRLIFNHTSAHNIRTWQPDQPWPIAAHISVAKSRLTLKGKIAPLARPVAASIDLKTHDFAAHLVEPFVARIGLRRLHGLVDSRLHIDIGDASGKAYRVKLAGHAQWKKGKLARRHGLTLAGDGFDWQGRMVTTAARANHQPATVTTDGAVQAHGVNLALAKTFKLADRHFSWHGKTRTTLGKHAVHASSDGRLGARGVVFAVPATARFNADRLQWQGQAKAIFAGLTSRQAKGRLHAKNLEFSVENTPLVMRADAMTFDGRYGQTAGAAHQQLTLTVGAGIDAQNLRAIDTAIGAPWVATKQAHADELKIDGLDRIELGRLKTQGLRVFGDTNTDSAVLQASSARASHFNIKRLRAYHLATLDIAGAKLHLRHDPHGMGVLSRFFAGSGKKNRASHGKDKGGAGATYAIDQARIAGPTAQFVDTTVNPNVHIAAKKMTLSVDGLDTAKPARPADYRLSTDFGSFGHFDSVGKIALLAPGGANMDLEAWMRSLALVPLSGYLNAAMGRTIAKGAADGTLDLKAKHGQLDGKLTVTLANLRLASGKHKTTDVVLGLSLDNALALVRSKNDTIKFSTAILGDITNPKFSVANLTREAIVAGLHQAVMSDYSPLGLLNKAKNAILDIGRTLSFHSIEFKAGKHYVPPDEREYLAQVGQTMAKKPKLKLTITGHAVAADADAISFFSRAKIAGHDRDALKTLAAQRAKAVRDYLAARNIATDRLTLGAPAINPVKKAKPRVSLSVAQ